MLRLEQMFDKIEKWTYNKSMGRNFSWLGEFFLIIFWVLRTLRFRRISCEKLRKYGKRAPGKGLRPLHSRQPFKKGWTLNF